MSMLLVLTKDGRWTDHWGREHRDSKELIDVTEVSLHPDGETVPHNNGYETYQASVWVDSQGRRWKAVTPIDFAGGTSYMFLPDDNEQPDPGYRWWDRYHPTLRLQRTVGKLTVPITSEVQLRRYL